jgi:hypothetical protein
MRSPSAEGGSPARPWAATSLLVNYENGQILSQVTRPMNAFDSLALWQARGSGVMNDAFWTTGARADGINRSTAVKTLYVTNGNGAAPFVLTTRNAANYRLLESTYDDLNLPADARAGLSLVPASQIPFRYSTYGPGAGRDTNLDRAMATVEQRLGRTVTLELAYNRERSKQWVKAPVNNSVLLTGDPNLVIPDPAGGPCRCPTPTCAGSIWRAAGSSTGVRPATTWRVRRWRGPSTWAAGAGTSWRGWWSGGG